VKQVRVVGAEAAVRWSGEGDDNKERGNWIEQYRCTAFACCCMMLIQQQKHNGYIACCIIDGLPAHNA